jgi:hypothetical protein
MSEIFLISLLKTCEQMGFIDRAHDDYGRTDGKPEQGNHVLVEKSGEENDQPDENGVRVNNLSCQSV